MKIFYLIILWGIVTPYVGKKDQESNDINLSYNILAGEFSTRKYIDDKGFLNFYINNEHFQANQLPEELNDSILIREKLVDINEFEEFVIEKKKELIKKGEKKGMIKIISNSEVFKTIYLYEIRENKIYKYEVTWVDEILD